MKNKEIVLVKNEIEISGSNRGIEINLNVTVGDILIDKRAESISIITKIQEFEKLQNDGKSYKYVRFERSNHKHTISDSDLISYYTVIKGQDIEEIKTFATQVMNGEKKISDFGYKSQGEYGLTTMNETYYLAIKDEISKQQDVVQLIKASIFEKTEAIKSQMSEVLSEFSIMITRLNNIIFTLEIYAGIEEKVKQIQSGQAASSKSPITLNQLTRFMDEEVGDPIYGGVSYDSIDKFDDWLLEKHPKTGKFNYEMLLPQEKSVRIMQVRRNASNRYTVDPWRNQWHILQEMNTYVMIRNGENIFTIDSKMKFADKLFPDQIDFDKIMEIEDEGRQFDALQKWKNGLVLMQGLVDRTDVFGAGLYGKINFLTTKSQDEGTIKFQYEIGDDQLITDGSKTFLDFLNTTTSNLGDRVLYLSNGDNWRASAKSDRFYNRWFQSEYSYPEHPDNGIYTLYQDESDEKIFYIKYLPSDHVWNGKKGIHVERKKKFRWRVYISEITPIDSISHRQIKWLNDQMYDRRDRIKYLQVVPLLRGLQKYKNEELELERPFVLMLISSTKKTEIEVLDAIHWWKTKNKWKRPLSEDDRKAYRMIIKKLNRDEK